MAADVHKLAEKFGGWLASGALHAGMALNELLADACPRDGIFTRLEARHRGLSNASLRTLQRSGVIEEIYPNVFRCLVVAMTPRAQVRAAVTAGGGLAVAGYSSALLLLGVDTAPRGRPEVILRGSVVPDLADVRWHRSRNLCAPDIVTIDGIPCTAGPRTVVDMAPRLSRTERIDLVDRCICARVATRPGLFERACALCNGRTGVRPICEVTAPDAEGVFWSALERLFGVRLAGTELPQPMFNAPLRHRGRLIVVDALWPEHDLVVELNGLRFHALREHRMRDDERSNILTHLRLRPLVFGWQDINEGFDTVATEIRAALHR